MTMKSLFVSYVVLLLVSFSVIHSNHALDLVHDESGDLQERAHTRTPNRKLLVVPDVGDGSHNRISGDSCSKENILVNQGATDPLPGSGIPTYTVTIENLSFSRNAISNIHLRCGWFSSAKLINPKIFRRLNYNDCLVNDGQPLTPGQTLTFVYANTYKYPLDVSSVQC